MNMRREVTWGVVAGIMVGLGVSSSVLADGKPLVVIRGSELSTWFSDPKDQGLAKAVDLLSTRLREIPGEVRAIANDPEADEAMAAISSVMPVVLGLLDHPCEFAVIDQGQMIGEIPDLDIRLIVDTGSASATENMTRSVQILLQMAGQGAQAQAWAQTSQMYMELPEAGQLMFGPASGDSKSFYIGIDLGRNGMDLSAVNLEAPEGLAGANLDWQMYVNGHAISDLAVRGLGSVDDPQAQSIVAMIGEIVPESEFSIVGGGAVHDGLRRTVLRFNGGVPFAKKISEFAQAFVGEIDVTGSPIDLDVLRLVPRDVNMMGAQVVDLSSMMGPVQMVAYQAGVPEAAAVVGAIGQHWIWYTSDETGGGGLSSLVFVQPDVNSEDMGAALGNLVTTLNSRAMVLRGYVRIRSWEGKVGGDVMPIHTITFPGLPVPLGLSIGVVDERLVAGVTPQGMIAAVDHWRSGRPSIMDNSQFRTAGRDLLDGATKVSFVDLGRSIMDGYHAAQMLGTLMENLVRSPSDPNRDVGLITPSATALAKNAKPMFSVSKTDGDDYVFIATTDPSVLVNVAGAAGASGPIPILVGAAILGGIMANEQGLDFGH